MELERIVTEVKQSEECETVQMNILEIGIEKGLTDGIGIEIGKADGSEIGLADGAKALIETCKKFGFSKEDTLTKIQIKLNLPKDMAEGYVEKFWK